MAIPPIEILAGRLAPFTFETETLGQAMKERDIDVGMDVHPSTVVRQSRRGHDLLIVAGWRNQQVNHVVARKSIAKLADLAGKPEQHANLVKIKEFHARIGF